MAVGVELGTAYVRIRPDMSGFKTGATSGVRSALSEVKAEVRATARSNVDQAAKNAEANFALARSYRGIASAAESGSVRAKVATQMAAKAQAEAMAMVGASATRSRTQIGRMAKEAVDADLIAIRENRTLARSYRQIGESAMAGSYEQVIAMRRAAKATAEADAIAGIAAVKSTRRVHTARGEHEEHREHHSRLREGLYEVAALGGLAFGAERLIEFGREATDSAIKVQKSVQLIKATFGSEAGEVVIGFGDKQAASLGVSAKVANEASARFGLLFKTLNIGKPVAAQMTVGWEKLVGTIAQLRGVDPEPLMKRVFLAAAGNIRGLKQLGIAVDSATIKQRAFSLGLIGSTKDALSPQIKSIALYSLATDHLGMLQKLAAKHANDLSNQEMKLGAEWENAKDLLGVALIPVFQKYTKGLSDYLQKSLETGRLQRQVNTVLDDAKQVIGAVAMAIKLVLVPVRAMITLLGGASNAVKVFMAAWAINKIIGIGGSIRTNLTRNIILTGDAAKVAAAEGKASFLGMAISAKAAGTAIKGALVSTGIGLLLVAVAFAATYVLDHWSKVKAYTFALAKGMAAIWAGLKDVLIGTAKAIAGGMATWLTAPFRLMLEAASKVSGFLGHFGIHIGGGASKALDALKEFTTGLTVRGAEQAARGGSEMAHAFGSAWTKTLKEHRSGGSKNPLEKLFDKPDGGPPLSLTGNVIPTALSNAVKTAKKEADHAKKAADGAKKAYESAAEGVRRARDAYRNAAEAVKTAQQSLSDAIREGNKNITDAVQSAKQNLNSLGGTLADQIQQIVDKQNAAGAGKLTGPLVKQFQRLKHEISTGTASPKVQKHAQELAAQIQSQAAAAARKAPKVSVAQQLSDLTDQLNKGEITVKQFNKRLHKILAGSKATYKNAGKLLGESFADGFKATVKAVQEQARLISGGPKRPGSGLEQTIVRPMAAVAEANRNIAKAQHDLAKAERDRAAKAQALSHAQLKEQQAQNVKLDKIAAATAATHKLLQKEAALRKAKRERAGKSADSAKKLATQGTG